jgi:phospholipase/carboxylesterase
MLKDYRITPPSPDSLVIMLHGVGANGEDLIGLGDVFRRVLPRTAFLSPDAPEPCDMAPYGRQWFSLRDYSSASLSGPDSAAAASSLLSGVQKAHPHLENYITKALAEFSLPASRCVLLGFSQGTMMSLYTGLRYGAGPVARSAEASRQDHAGPVARSAEASRQDHAGPVARSAEASRQDHAGPVARSAEGMVQTTRLAGILGYSGAMLGAENLAPPFPRISLIHGTVDEVVPVFASRHAAETLRAKGAEVDLHLYEGLGHSIDDHGVTTGAAFLQRVFAG